jgi:hypothetical protein
MKQCREVRAGIEEDILAGDLDEAGKASARP